MESGKTGGTHRLQEQSFMAQTVPVPVTPTKSEQPSRAQRFGFTSSLGAICCGISPQNSTTVGSTFTLDGRNQNSCTLHLQSAASAVLVQGISHPAAFLPRVHEDGFRQTSGALNLWLMKQAVSHPEDMPNTDCNSRRLVPTDVSSSAGFSVNHPDTHQIFSAEFVAGKAVNTCPGYMMDLPAANVLSDLSSPWNRSPDAIRSILHNESHNPDKGSNVIHLNLKMAEKRSKSGRRKHRPKVVKEEKATKTPAPRTPKMKQERRKYMKKNLVKRQASLTGVKYVEGTEPSELRKPAEVKKQASFIYLQETKCDGPNQGVKSSCRRKLNFELNHQEVKVLNSFQKQKNNFKLKDCARDEKQGGIELCSLQAELGSLCEPQLNNNGAEASNIHSFDSSLLSSQAKEAVEVALQDLPRGSQLSLSHSSSYILGDSVFSLQNHTPVSHLENHETLHLPSNATQESYKDSLGTQTEEGNMETICHNHDTAEINFKSGSALDSSCVKQKYFLDLGSEVRQSVSRAVCQNCDTAEINFKSITALDSAYAKQKHFLSIGPEIHRQSVSRPSINMADIVFTGMCCEEQTGVKSKTTHGGIINNAHFCFSDVQNADFFSLYSNHKIVQEIGYHDSDVRKRHYNDLKKADSLSSTKKVVEHAKSSTAEPSKYGSCSCSTLLDLNQELHCRDNRHFCHNYSISMGLGHNFLAPDDPQEESKDLDSLKPVCSKVCSMILTENSRKVAHKPSKRRKTAKVHFLNTMDEVIQGMKCLNIIDDDYDKNADTLDLQVLVPYSGGGHLVPYDSSRRRKQPRPKVDVDEETNRMWNLLMWNLGNLDLEEEKKWEDERNSFEAKAVNFIHRMHMIQGDRRFTRWKGSVVDSVIGVFLTQNVSDHLSSSAFMAIAAKYPRNSRSTGCLLHAGGRQKFPNDPNASVLEYHTTMDKMFKEKGVCEMENVEENMISSIESFGCSMALNMEEYLHENEQELNQELLEGKRETAGSPGSIVSSRSSMIPPAILTNSDIQRTDQNESSSVSNTEADNPLTGVEMAGFSPNKMSFMKLLQMQGPEVLQVLYGDEGDKLLSDIHHEGAQLENQSSGFGSCFSCTCSFARETDSPQILIKEDVVMIPEDKCELFSNDSTSFFPSGLTNDSSMEKSHHSVASTVQAVSPSLSYHQSVPVVSSCLPTTDQSNCHSLTSGIRDPTCALELRNACGNSELQLRLSNHKNQGESPDSRECSGLTNKYKAVCCMAVESDSSYHLCSCGKATYATRKRAKNKKENNQSNNRESFDWESLRREVYSRNPNTERTPDTMDSLDYEAVRQADVDEISQTIRERGMNNMLAKRIKDFLNRLVHVHGSIDLEWLRDITPDKAKEFLLSIRGLGLKSVECVRLLSLHHNAFPVDTNVGRIVVRLGWVPLQPLPESLQLHLLELYPVLESIQKFLWPRLCKLDQQTL